jgi:HEPN domain-containing protein
MGRERYRDWIEEALDDLDAALELFRAGKWSKVCYSSHQAVEKALKALAIKKLGLYRSTHSVAELVGLVGSYIDLQVDLIERAKRLDRFYIPTRYPNAWPALPPYKHYSRIDAEEALETAKVVVRAIAEKVERDP